MNPTNPTTKPLPACERLCGECSEFGYHCMREPNPINGAKPHQKDGFSVHAVARYAGWRDEGDKVYTDHSGWIGERELHSVWKAAQEVMAPNHRESDLQLMRFYSVDSLEAVIDMQSKQIERLQKKLSSIDPGLKDFVPLPSRIG